MKVIAVIPARYDATRFPGKLMEMLGDKTVITTTYRNVQETGLFDDVFVATDSQLIFNEVAQNGGKAVLTGMHETGSDRIAEAVQSIDCDIVINVQGDEPFLKKKPLSQLIQVFEEDVHQEVSLASLKVRMRDFKEVENPNNVKVITDHQDFALYFSRSVIPYPREEKTEIKYYKHIGVYAFRKQTLIKFAGLAQKDLEKAEKIECIRYLEYGMRIKLLETDFIGVGIDTPEDLEKARKIMFSPQ
ncbi:3-deoxy-manno-octulosonate cytidylyltransferase [Elizabethkingia argentiflava]|uniref:3-deoxy-manno-octulosonate cytidylyltransferase n=1 Tax=Elizabethkingia argenteiflava TaxID=2681556 RepID=A0A845PTL2_9FLAO|nr:3-deoxy-manno-octulosonate cytidylyltransferase [Elizabethkingia argenteiflava]NAW50975.1 3-deoxy-manno-octulosonate cytidylyltransferase [Elizabethkingia argenteiflava]